MFNLSLTYINNVFLIDYLYIGYIVIYIVKEILHLMNNSQLYRKMKAPSGTENGSSE